MADFDWLAWRREAEARCAAAMDREHACEHDLEAHCPACDAEDEWLDEARTDLPRALARVARLEEALERVSELLAEADCAKLIAQDVRYVCDEVMERALTAPPEEP